MLAKNTLNPMARYGLLCLGIWMIACGSTAAQVGYSFGRNKVQYTKFDWHILKTEHFDVYYYPEMKGLAEIGAAYAEEYYTVLQNRFRFYLGTRVPLIFYASNLHFKQTNTTDGFIPDGVGGFFEFLKGRVVLPANGDLHRFKRVIRHELVHVFTFNKITRILRDYRKPADRLPPLWFTEGLAEYWSGEADFQHQMMLRDAIVSNYLVPLEDILRINGTYLMYKQGESVCRYIAEKYGDEALLRLIEEIWRFPEFEKVIEHTLGLKFRAFGAAWEAWLRAQYRPDFPTLLPPSKGATRILTRGFYSKPSAYEAPDGTRWVFAQGNAGGFSNLYGVKVDSAYKPLGKPRILVKGERQERFEAFHLFESRISVSKQGVLAFVTKSGEQDVLHLYDLARKRVIQTLRFPELVALYSPTWHPDGEQIAFSGLEKSGFADLYVYDLQARQLQKLTNDPYDDRDPDWSPDGKRLVFGSDRAGRTLEPEASNLFVFDLETRQTQALTTGAHLDLSPRWSPDGQHVIFIRSEREENGKWSPQNVWLADTNEQPRTSPRRLTAFTAVGFDPIWTKDGYLLLSVLDGGRFGVLSLGKIQPFLNQATPEKTKASPFLTAEAYQFPKLENISSKPATEQPYKRRYTLDAAQTLVNQNAVYGVNGGGYLLVSDMLGNDYFYFTLYNTSRNQSQFLRSMSFSLSRFQFNKRTSTAYGVYRVGGLRYDLTDPDAASEYPVFWETEWGGFGAISYPLSFFNRVEVATSLTWSDKEIWLRSLRRKALLLSNSVSFVHDSALYGMNGPMDGFRANLSLGYTTDVWRSNVSYYTAIADLRKYWRILPTVSVAARGMARINEGKEARLFFMGGSWDLRGYPLFDVRGRKTWLASTELRFPIIENPALIAPVLEPFGIVNLRGAVFYDAGHAWNAHYTKREPQLLAGETLRSAGFGVRMNLFGGIVLRYDFGWRFRETTPDAQRFRQFLFGFDF